jgi:hypothetical protein
MSAFLVGGMLIGVWTTGAGSADCGVLGGCRSSVSVVSAWDTVKSFVEYVSELWQVFLIWIRWA